MLTLKGDGCLIKGLLVHYMESKSYFGNYSIKGVNKTENIVCIPYHIHETPAASLVLLNNSKLHPLGDNNSYTDIYE